MLPYKDREGEGKKGCGYNEISIKWEELALNWQLNRVLTRSVQLAQLKT